MINPFAVHDQKKTLYIHPPVICFHNLCIHPTLFYHVICFHNNNMFLEATSYIHKDNVYKYSESGIVYSVDEIFQLQPLIFDILAVPYSLHETNPFTQTIC